MHAPPRGAILVVEDEAITAIAIQETLRELGYDAYAVAATSEEAIQRASERCPDLVLMDIHIKGRVDGIQAAELLKDRFGVPVVYLTAHSDSATVARAKLTGPHGYLVKPVGDQELFRAIELSLYRHALDAQVSDRARWYATALDAIADAVVVIDLAGRVSFMNPAAERITGVRSSDAVGRAAREVLRLEGAEGPASSALERAVVEPRVPARGTARLAREGSPPREIADAAAPLMSDGRLLGAVVVLRDVTDERRQQRRVELDDRVASLASMAAGVCEAVHNPLAVVSSNGAFVREELTALCGDVAHALVPWRERLLEAERAQSELLAAAERVRTVMQDLQWFARAPEPAPGGVADVASTVAWAVHITEERWRTRAQVVTRTEGVGLAAVDEGRLGQVMVNLIAHAAQAMEPGQVERNLISVTARRDDPAGIVIEVADSGPGLSPGAVARAFDPFADGGELGAGGGFGLALSRGIVAALGGRLEVDSELGRGTTLRLSVPAVPEPAGAGPVSAQPGRDGAASAVPATGAARRARIVVLDDEVLILRAVGRLLREHEVITTSDPDQAIALMLAAPRPDLILCDVTMPGATGQDVYERVLAVDPLVARRIAFMSGGALTDELVRFMAATGARRIEKPFDAQRLRTVIQQWLAS